MSRFVEVTIQNYISDQRNKLYTRSELYRHVLEACMGEFDLIKDGSPLGVGDIEEMRIVLGDVVVFLDAYQSLTVGGDDFCREVKVWLKDAKNFVGMLYVSQKERLQVNFFEIFD
jgi:hypothetical protein